MSGTVQRNGKAITGGTIVFAPIGGGKPAHGVIEPDGSFKLSTATPYDGAMIGPYQVTVMGERVAEDESGRQTFQSPRDKPIEVVPGNENNFALDVGSPSGWLVE